MGLDQVGSGRIRLDLVGSGWICLDRLEVESGRIVSDGVGLSQIGFGRIW